jgi:hypothetical protein
LLANPLNGLEGKAMEKTYRIKLPTPQMAKNELDEVARAFGTVGNDMDVLTQSMVYLMAERYRESMELSSRVMPPPSGPSPIPTEVSQAAARDSYLQALVRAKPLYEQAASEIEGAAEGSQTMKAYNEVVRALTEEDSW